MISIQSLRKQELAEEEARRKRELAAQKAAHAQVQGFNFGEPLPAQQKQGVLKFARFLYDS